MPEMTNWIGPSTRRSTIGLLLTPLLLGNSSPISPTEAHLAIFTHCGLAGAGSLLAQSQA